MIKKTSRYLLAACLLCLSQFAMAQFEIGLHSQANNFQKNLLNPAVMMDDTLSIALPSAQYRVASKGPALGDFVGTTLDANALIAELNGDNSFLTNLQVNTFNVGLRKGKWQFTLGQAFKYSAFTAYSDGIPQVAFKGNAPFIGETIDLSNDINVYGLSEWKLGAAYEINDRLSVGANVKYLNGTGSISTAQNELSLFTDPDIYQITLTSDYLLNTTSPIELNVDTLAKSASFSDIAAIQPFSQNNGIGIDFGVHYQLDKVGIALSAVDFGMITWDDAPNNYTSNQTATFEGLDIAAIVFDESANFSSIVDTIEQIFAFESSQNAYTTKLNAKFFAGLDYQLSSQLNLGVLAYFENMHTHSRYAVGLSGQYTLSEKVSFGANYSFINGSADNLGLNGIVTLGPVQVFATTNNVLYLVNGGKSSNFSTRIGVNLLFGKGKKPIIINHPF